MVFGAGAAIAAGLMIALVASLAFAGDPVKPPSPGIPHALEAPGAILERLDRDMQDLARRTRSSAVEVSVRMTPRLTGGHIERSGGSLEKLFVDDSPVYFSGTLLDGAGLVVTAGDAVRLPATRISVRLADGEVFRARPLGVGASLDVGLLCLESEGRPLKGLVPAIGDSSALRPGSLVMAIGSPFGLAGSVTTGIVSGIGRKLIGSSGEYRSLIQVTSPVNPGDAGAPLVDAGGRLVGVMALTYRRGAPAAARPRGEEVFRDFRVFCQAREGEVPEDPVEVGGLWSEFLSAKASAVTEAALAAETAGDDAVTEGIHFAFPINDVRRAVSEILARSGDRALSTFASGPPPLGFRYLPVGEALASQLGLESGAAGVVVDEVNETGPAARSGLMRFDIILSIGGRPLGGPEDVIDIASRLEPGIVVSIVVLRRAERLILEYVPGR